MSHLRAHRLLSVAMQRLERGEKPKRILHAIKGAVEDLQDPFAGEIDEFLREKARKLEEPNETLRKDPSEDADESPQEEIEERMEDLSEEKPTLKDEMPGDIPQDSPQEQAEDNYDDELEKAQEEKVDDLEEQKQDIEKEIDKVQKRDEEYAESALRDIAKVAQERGYSALANKFTVASLGGVTDILNDLLMHEYLQRDISVNYFYLFDESHSSYLKQHFESEKDRMVYLQKAVIELGGTPTTKRFTIPPVNPLTSEGVMGLITELEKQAVTEYLAAAQSLEAYPEHTALRVWLENIAVEEDVDTQEMEALK